MSHSYICSRRENKKQLWGKIVQNVGQGQSVTSENTHVKMSTRPFKVLAYCLFFIVWHIVHLEIRCSHGSRLSNLVKLYPPPLELAWANVLRGSLCSIAGKKMKQCKYSSLYIVSRGSIIRGGEATFFFMDCGSGGGPGGSDPWS